MTTIYTRLGRDDEWLIGIQPSTRFDVYHFAIVRDGMLLLQGDFNILPGEDLAARMRQAIAEWKLRPSTWHRLFHQSCTGFKKDLPMECNGKCPWKVPLSELRSVCETWYWIVPSRLRRQGCTVFKPWAAPPAEIRMEPA